MADALSIEQARDLFERRRKAWLAEDVDAYLALWSDHLSIALPGRDEISGKAAYRRVVEQSFAHIAPESWTNHHLAVDGAHVLSEWTIGGHLRRPVKPVSWRGMAVCRIEDGLIVEWREYWDPVALRRQLGVD